MTIKYSDSGFLDGAGNDTDVVAEKYQYEFMSDPNGEIFRLGYSSVAEVEALV